MTDWLDAVNWNADGLVPAIAQEAATGAVLTQAWMNREALERTAATHEAHYWSRSRGRLWRKGETSGNRLAVTEILVDCDDDTVLVKVKRQGDGNVCHTGERTCFYRKLDAQ